MARRKALRVLTLILGGARSGKSSRAQALAESLADTRVYLATAQAFDDEMADRIARHRADRGAGWRTVEAPVDLPRAVADEGRPGRVLLIDCLTLWTSNLMHAEIDVAAAGDALIAALSAAACPVVMVSNEVGLGIVPDNALARRFRDAAGRLHQQVAERADHVEFMVAGLPMRLK
ncbi:bifunctional adenosylcobinamide kinase/adenosylcobinamide-phosphate guanylyltransferase [Sphingomonas sp. CCH18-H6]|uniref:bifunctional adenosylcobinamide kinase/adenosylcobinamide-phosphate guanylyltransferase n=1 Tax=Sphingomonas sp. CCH18-H6 TaxID=1768787 RepID=UPI00082CDB32|nr:bifunctional adenosylcobinamide kinase/adenosylcobinamide-phosphate guanylyltransferase [Sphingomonas sp. CCH18-H6]